MQLFCHSNLSEGSVIRMISARKVNARENKSYP
jgi:uncharacterized DUF497 family protein